MTGGAGLTGGAGATGSTGRRPVILGWVRGYDRAWLPADVLAGLVAGAVVIPQAMGYATVAGLPVQVGLYTCMVPMVLYAIFGGARRLSMSTTSTIVALTGLGLASAGVGDDPDAAMAAVATLTLMVGLALVLFAVIRIGWVVDAISDVVIVGLKVGVGLTIIVEQLPDLMGIEPSDGGFLSDVAHAVKSMGAANGATVLVAGATLAVMIVARRWPRLPGPLIGLVGGILAVVALDLDDHGVELIAQVPSGLPLPALPSTEHVATFAPFALAIALMAYTETIAVGRSTREPLDPPISNNRELAANGVAALAGGLFSTAPPAGGFSQTMVNANAGARTQLSELVTAALAVAVAVFFAPVLDDLPQATLAAIVVIAVAGLIDVGELRRIGRIDRAELGVALLTGVIALATNLLVGVLAGVLGTFYLVLRRLNHPAIVELRRDPAGGDLEPARPGDHPVPGLLALRIEGGLYTMNVRAVQAEILARVDAADPPPRVVLIDARGTPDASVTVMDVVAETDQQLSSRGVTLWVADLPTAALARVRRTAAWSTWRDAGKLHAHVRDAVAAFEALSADDPDVRS